MAPVPKRSGSASEKEQDDGHLAALPAGVIDVHGRQVLHLLLGDVELDDVDDLGNDADRDDHLPAAKHMPLLQQHVAHMVVPRVDDKPSTRPISPSVA